MSQKEKPFDYEAAKREIRQRKVHSILEGLGYDPEKTRLEDLRGDEAKIADIKLTSRTSAEERERMRNCFGFYEDYMGL